MKKRTERECLGRSNETRFQDIFIVFFLQKQTLVLIYEELYIRKTVLEWENWFPEEYCKRSHNTSQLNAFFPVRTH